MLYRNTMARIAGLDLSYDVVQCSDCGAVFADKLASPLDYETYYRHCSKYDSIASVSDISVVDRRRAEFGAAFAGQHAREAGRVLDLGCGSGVLLAEFVRAGWREAKGIDPAPNAPSSALRLFGLDGVRQGTVTAVGEYFALRDFDLICMTAVLEHLTDPAEALRAIAADMRPASSLLVEVPALESFARAPLEPHGEFSIEHINFFSRRALIDTAARAGLRPIAGAILDLWPFGTDSSYVLFQKGSAGAEEPANRNLARDYIAESADALRPVLDRAARAIRAGGAVIWGAGSHSARLVPMLEDMGLGRDIDAVVDSNPNLHGRSFGRHEVLPPDALQSFPHSMVIVSSFRSSAAISANLKKRFPNAVCELYPPLPAAGGVSTRENRS
jgi:SAM-dependent methyltransferase